MQIDYEYECTISILIENQPSILPRIVGLLTRRGFKVDSLAIGSTEYTNTSRIILILPGNLRVVDQVTRQLYKLLPVIKIQNLTLQKTGLPATDNDKKSKDEQYLLLKIRRHTQNDGYRIQTVRSGRKRSLKIVPYPSPFLH